MQGPTQLPAEDETSRQIDLEFRGKLRVLREKDDPRLCSDIPCLALFVVHCCVLATLCGLSLSQGDPDWLRSGWDYHARVCGVHPSKAHFPFVYWPIPEELSLGLCVKRCPDAEDFERSAKVVVPRAEPLLKREVGIGVDLNISFSQSAELREVHIYPTAPALGRFCIPAPETDIGLASPGVADGQDNVVSGAGSPKAKDTLLPALLNIMGRKDEQLRRTVGGLQEVWWSLAICIVLVPLIAGALPTTLAARRAALPTLWALVVAFGVGALGLGARLLVYWSLRGGDYTLATLNDLELILALFGGGCLVLVGVLTLLFGLILRDLLHWAAACAEASAGAAVSEGLTSSLGLVSLGVAFIQALLSLAWLLILEMAASSAWLDWPAVLPATTDRDYEAESDDLAEVIPGGPLVRGLRRHPEFFCPMLPLLVLWALLLRAALAFVASLGQSLVAYIVVRWYFSEPLKAAAPLWRRLGRRPVCAGFDAVAGAHLGGVAASAAAHALLPSLSMRAAAVALHKVLAPWKRGGEPCRSLGLGAGGLAAMLGTGPSAEVAMFAGHAHLGAARTARTVSQALPAAQFVSNFPALYEAAACSFAWLAASGGVLLLRLWGQQHWETGYVETQVGIAMLGGFLAVYPTSAWLLSVTACFDALLECFMCDDAHHRIAEESVPRPSRWAVSVDASYALWSSKHTPARIRSLVFEAAQTVQQDMARGARRSAHSFKDATAGYGYVPVGISTPMSPEGDE